MKGQEEHQFSALTFPGGKQNLLCVQHCAQLLLGQTLAQTLYSASLYQLTFLGFCSEFLQSYSLQSSQFAGEVSTRSCFSKHQRLLPHEARWWAGESQTAAVSWHFKQENCQEERGVSSIWEESEGTTEAGILSV